MGLLGTLLSAPFKIVNAPIRAAENVMDIMCGEDGHVPESERLASKPLKMLSDELDKI